MIGPFALRLPGGIEEFAWPWALFALPLPLPVRLLLPALRGPRAQAALRVPFGNRLDRIGSGRGAAPGAGLGAWLACLAWALLCVAAARPQSLGQVLQPPQAGREMMLAVDLSASMGEEDMELGGRVVDRLTAAKAVLADCLERRAGDRVGLVVFGQRAFVLAPLTLDRDTVRQQLEDSVVGLAGRETAIGDAIALAVRRLRTQPSGQRVLVLLTDGVNTAGALDPDKATELARAEGVRIHTVAFGGYGEALNVFGVPLRIPSGTDTTDEAGLARIAEATGGRAFRARDADELAGIYAEIDRIEPVERPGERVRPRIERYAWPLGAALALGVAGLAWPRRRRAWTA